ncbi:hypothetical protein T484DRAFT_1922556, partial [Baffinella frigidus]
MYKEPSGSGVCTACGADTYQEKIGMTWAGDCTVCALHASAPAKSDNKTDCICDSAYFGPLGGPCALCEAD